MTVTHDFAKYFQRFALRRGGKSEITGVRQEFTPFHHGVYLVLVVHVIVGRKAGQGKVHLRGVPAALP